MKGKTISFYTLGCKLNFAETSAISRRFSEAGYVVTPFGQPADVVIINSCSVTSVADKKCRQAISKAAHHSPEAFIAVIGCYAQLQAEALSSLPNVNLVLGTDEKFNVLERVESALSGNPETHHSCEIGQVSAFHAAHSLSERTRAFLKVQDGCDYHCAYCTIPLARGNSRNAPIRELLEEARLITASGVSEIVLTGVNIGDFGKSTREDFSALLEGLESIDGLTRLRISSIEPNLLSDQILERAAQSRVIVPHFHIPLQSGSDKILGLMRRRYRRSVFEDRLDRILRAMPHACVGADVITGFPGETEADFSDTLSFLQDMPVSYLHVFPYSERPDTPAASFEGKVPIREREIRCKTLIRLSEKKRADFYREHLGQIRPVLVEGRSKNGLAGGFTDNYIKVEIPHQPGLTGKILPVKLLSINASGTVTGQIPATKELQKTPAVS